MDVSRRFFLLGSGLIITNSFVSTARRFISKTGDPFLLPEASARQIIYASEVDRGDSMGFLITVGEPRLDPDYLPTWGEFFQIKGHDLSCESTFEQLSESWEVSRADLRLPMDEYTWECAWSANYSPSARGFLMLQNLEWAQAGRGHRPIGGLEFNEGQYPGSFDRWVDAEDALSVSLLHARLRELSWPAELRLGKII